MNQTGQTHRKSVKITDLLQIQELCYEILCDIDDFCKEHEITYFLSGGSCLGAVRHKDFIPWDDDIDIMFPRDDYEKFVKEFHSTQSEKYTVGTLLTNKDWARPAGRVWRNDTQLIHSGWTEMPMGIFVDIFPIDGLPENRFHRWIHYKCTMVLQVCRSSAFHVVFGKHEHAKALKFILAPICKVIGARRFAIVFDKLIRRYHFSDRTLVGAISAAHYWDRETMKKEDMSSQIYTEFHGRKFPIPVGHDRYLSSLYGDYMQMPSQKKIEESAHRDDWEILLYIDE